MFRKGDDMRVFRNYMIDMFEVGRLKYRGKLSGRIINHVIVAYKGQGETIVSSYNEDFLITMLVKDIPEDIDRTVLDDPFLVFDVRKAFKSLDVLELEFLDEIR